MWKICVVWHGSAIFHRMSTEPWYRFGKCLLRIFCHGFQILHQSGDRFGHPRDPCYLANRRPFRPDIMSQKKATRRKITNSWTRKINVYNTYIHIYIYIYIYGKCLGFARTRNDDGRRIIIIIIIINIMIINIIIIIINNIIKPLLTIFNECRSLTGVGELNPYWRSSMNVEV